MAACKQNELKLNKNVILDLTENVESGYDVISFGKNKFTMRDFRQESGGSECLSYGGILCNNGKQLCECFSEGWGGMTELKPLSVIARALMMSIKLKLGEVKWQYRNEVRDCTLDFIADMLARNEYTKLNRTLKGKC